MDRFDRIPFTDLSPESTWIKLGQGSFGCVFKGVYLGLEVAIKEVLPSGEYDVDKYFEREVVLMQQARHPNIVQYLGLSLAPPSAPPTPTPTNSPQTKSNNRILIISEFLPRGNLRQYILDDSLPLPWRLRLSFAIDLARALAYMHARKCLHRDLKGENLLVTENLRVKVCDFGFARLAAVNEEERRRMSYCGTDGYMSPEILMGDSFDLPTDIFSLGVILSELLSRRIASNKTFARQLPSFGIDPDEIRSYASPHCPESLIALALQCLEVEPELRPSAVQVLSALLQIEKEVKDAQERGELGEERGGSWHAGSIGYAGWGKKGQQTRRRMDLARQLPTKWDSAGEEESSEDEVEVFARLNSHAAGESHARLMDEPSPIESQFASNITVKAGESLTATYRTDPRSTLPRLPQSWLDAVASGETSTSSEDDAPHTPPQDEFNGSTIKPLKKTNKHKVAAEDSFVTAFGSAFSTSTAGAVVGHGGSSHEEEDDSLDGSTLTILPSPARAHQQFYSASDVTPQNSGSSLIPPVTHRFSLIKPSFRRFLGALPELSPSAGKRGSTEAQRKRGSLDARGRKGSGGSGGSGESVGDGMTISSPKANERDGVCGVCEKKLGFLKAHLECDDCAFRCHIKCSDACPPGCDPPHSPLAPIVPPASPPATPTTAAPQQKQPASPTTLVSTPPRKDSPARKEYAGPSKLLKKRASPAKPVLTENKAD